MTKIVKNGLTGSLSDLNISQGDFRSQLGTLVDSVRQLGGNPNIAQGAAATDPLSAPYVLYVNPQIGSDTFVQGDYNTNDDGTLDSKLRRVSNQRLECGYTMARPFRTINRAVIEAAIISSRNYATLSGVNGDLVSIMLAPGVTNILNGPGTAVSAEWLDGKNPTDAELQAFNPSTGGLILPRGCSLCSLDLRKAIIRPTYVPLPADEAADLSNRSCILRMTGGGYYFGFTFFDKQDSNESHHLLDCFQYASQADLTEFYGKIRAAFGGAQNSGNIDNTLAVPRASEYQIVGSFPADGDQTSASDTTKGASPYIYNCSARSELGLCGILADGSKVSGLKSVVTAQFTGVSLQRDLSCWQKFTSGGSGWGAFANYADYIATDPDNVRMNPDRRSYHIRAVGNSIIQEVSVFAIGQGIHHWVQKGGEITLTNSNSNFGGCAALAEDYKAVAFKNDTNWTVSRLRVATDLTEKFGNVSKIYLGNVAEGQTNATIQAQGWFNLATPLADSQIKPGIPEVLQSQQYSLPLNSYLWVENPSGNDYRVQIPANAWLSSAATRLNFTGTFINEDGIAPGDPILTATGVATGQLYPALAGRRVYIRRLKDSRSTEERRYSLILNNTVADARLPLRDYVLQSDISGASINSLIPETQLLTVMQTGGEEAYGAGVAKTANVVVRRNNAVSTWEASALYRPGDNITRNGKHYMCIKQTSSATFVESEWRQAFVHMESGYNNEDFLPNAQPSIIFDNDTDGAESSTTLGYNLSTVWASDALIRAQYRSATDYRGLHSFLTSLGFTSNDAHTILLPKVVASRDRNPGAALSGVAAPGGVANSWANWPIEFRRPSNIRLFGHAYEWAGTLNYTKALPFYQKELGTINKFTYYFTHQNGGRVYASGFNEEGFLVSNSGLEDLATGASFSVDQLGNDANSSIDFPTFYESLAANELTVNNKLILSGQVDGSPTWTENASYLDGVNKVNAGPFGEVLPALPTATTTQRGVIELATIDEVKEFLSDNTAVTPASLIQALGDAVKSVVNARISLSATSPVPDSNQSGGNLYLHPWNGNEIALYSAITLRWSVVRFSGVRTFSLSGLAANTNYDVYVYNSGTALAPTLSVEFLAWSGNLTPPTRGTQDGVFVRSNNASRRLIGVIRTITAGQSIVDLGGVIASSGQASYPRMYVANHYNLYDVRARYFFGSSWNSPASGWSVPAGYTTTPPRCAMLQASNTMVTAFLDIYSNAPGLDSIAYVAPGINTTSGPPDDAFYGESRGNDQTAGSQWAQSLNPGLNEIYYLYKQLGSATNTINEHAAHGIIVISKA
jgi:hypothetical protein